MRTKRTGGKTPEEAISPDNNATSEDPDDNALYEDRAHKHTNENSHHRSDAGNVLGLDVSVGSNDDPREEFDERELDDCGELLWIHSQDETETRTPILSLSESGRHAKMF